MNKFDTFRFFFPVLVVDKINKENRNVLCQNVYGTAFAISDNIFLTAGHVVDALKGKKESMLGIYDRRKNCWKAIKIAEIQRTQNFDLGVIRVNTKTISFSKLKWDFSEQLPMLSDVQTAGYAQTFDPATGWIGIRSFKGHIVSNSPPYEGLENYGFYELSFYCPKGLSGAPIYSSDKEEVIVKGIITDVVVSDQNRIPIAEVIEKEEKKIYERSEVYYFGRAIDVRFLANIKLPFLDIPLKEYLSKRNLIINNSM
ncbi:MAG TPA: hypothetical protein PLH56_03535 [Candidatus Omnitrophota bacterium]|nr:hypothetical protein [Candidatus Omnitrophota bacterium]HPN88387.1 hypothetical protein [Candidatus Omnitrophota bacterium]